MSAACTHLSCPAYDMVLSRRHDGERCGTCGRTMRGVAKEDCKRVTVVRSVSYVSAGGAK